MARIIDYQTVVNTLTASGLRCVYPHSGAFGLPRDVTMHALGWIGGDDESIREELRPRTKRVEPPIESNLAQMVCDAWSKHFQVPIWLMPASHWAFELQFGGADWIPEMLTTAGIDSNLLRDRTDGSAVEFTETGPLRTTVQTLFEKMVGSDFTIAFPGRPIIAMLHHHKQVWWQTSDPSLLEMLTD